MNKSVTIELDWDTIDRITTSAIKDALRNLEFDLKDRKEVGDSTYFVLEKEKDIALLEKHIDAFKLVLEYYGEKIGNKDEQA
jgi:hypothetical protein